MLLHTLLRSGVPTCLEGFLTGALSPSCSKFSQCMDVVRDGCQSCQGKFAHAHDRGNGRTSRAPDVISASCFLHGDPELFTFFMLRLDVGLTKLSSIGTYRLRIVL